MRAILTLGLVSVACLGCLKSSVTLSADAGEPALDAGQQPAPDAGGLDAGVIGDAGLEDAGAVDAGEPIDAGEPDAGITVEEECAKPANLDRRAEIVARQPWLAVRSKRIIARTDTFQSLDGHPEIACPVELTFKDLDGNSVIDAYEDWTLAPQQRATDLLARMTPAQKMGLMAHATLTDSPTASDASVSASLQSLIAAGIRFGRTSANTAKLVPRATWANNLQEICEASPLGIPFVLSSEPAHSTGVGRSKAVGFSQWPNELSLAAGRDAARIGEYGRFVSQEYRAIGIRMALSPSADLATDPRWPQAPFTFGENATLVADMVAAYIRGMQGTTLGPSSVACVAKHFPGAGAAKGGWDARLAKGKYLAYPGNNIDAHLSVFSRAITSGVAGVMPGYAIAESGNWSGLGGLIQGTAIEQVGASFNAKLLTDVLRAHYAFPGFVLAPWGVLEDAGVDPFGAPWGVESRTKAQRAAKAVNAGVDQFGGLNDTAPLSAARTAGLISDAQVDAAAGRMLTLVFQLGLFENPYAAPEQATSLCNSDPAFQAGMKAMQVGLVLLVNKPKPVGWFNGNGDGTQLGDKCNAGNGSLKVLPAPPGPPYLITCAEYFVQGAFDLDFVRSVSSGYGSLTNDWIEIDMVPVSTDAERIARSDYVFIRLGTPFRSDPDSGTLQLPTEGLEYAGSDNAAALAQVAAARAAIDALADSKAQIIVILDGGRPSVVSEILNLGVSGVYIGWGINDFNVLNVSFGIVNGTAKLPVGLPLSNAAAASQNCDAPGDGEDATFVEGFGLTTTAF